MELVKNGTLDILMRHELTEEEVSIQSHSGATSTDAEPHAQHPPLSHEDFQPVSQERQGVHVEGERLGPQDRPSHILHPIRRGARRAGLEAAGRAEQGEQ